MELLILKVEKGKIKGSVPIAAPFISVESAFFVIKMITFWIGSSESVKFRGKGVYLWKDFDTIRFYWRAIHINQLVHFEYALQKIFPKFQLKFQYIN